MRKILNILGTIVLLINASVAVVSCSSSHQKINIPATLKQEQDALINFAEVNGINESEINENNWSFQNETVQSNQEIIDFTFEENHNVKNIKNESQLLKQFTGKMIYHLDSQKFNLKSSNFKNPNLIPGYYQSSLNVPSTITGNANDFTISAGYDDLDSFVGDLGRPDVQTLWKLFKAMNWKYVANFNGLTVQDLSNLEESDPLGWELPAENYMATIHAVKENGIYKVAWTNLRNNQDKKVLPETNGDLQSLFWKGEGVYHLWCNYDLVNELNQLYQLYVTHPNQNPWFKPSNLNKWLKLKAADSGIGVETVNNTYKPYKDYNTSNYQLDQTLNNLNSVSFQNWFSKNNKYKKYDLVFKKDFSFDPSKSSIATKEFN